MDNLAHMLSGFVIANAGLRRVSPHALPMLVVASNLPDIDCVARSWGMPPYLCYHRGITHALLGMALLSLALPLVWWCATRLGRMRSTMNAPAPFRFWPLVMVAAAGIFLHTAMDAFNAYGVRPWLPFDGTWYYGDALFIIDPWLWLILLWGTFAVEGAGPIERSTIVLAAVACAGTVFFATVSELRASVPIPATLLWVALFGLLQWARLRRSSWATGPRAARLALAAAVLYVACLFGVRALVERHGHERLPPTIAAAIERTSVRPTPVVPWRGSYIVQTRGEIVCIGVDLLTGEHVETRYERRIDSAVLARIARTREAQAWRIFARHPVMERIGSTVVLDDARYRLRADTPSWSAMSVELEAEGK